MSSGGVTSNTAVLTVTPPAAPGGVFAVSGTGQATVSWAPVSGATSYNIYWGTTAGVTTASTKITGATSPYVHTGLTTGGTYYYRVSALNALGETLSSEIFAFLYAGGNPAGSFVATGSTNVMRSGHTATLLPTGKVLVAGGNSANSAELYDPATGTFSYTGNMTSARNGHRATLLPNGKVLLTGGSYYNALGSPVWLNSAELYDPATGTFTAISNMASNRNVQHTATLLPNGKVLIAGGYYGLGSGASNYLNSTELYDPATGTLTAAGTLPAPRAGHSATLLPDGNVLIAAGGNFGGYPVPVLYNPDTGVFTATGTMIGQMSGGQTDTLLPNGNVLFTYSGSTPGISGWTEKYNSVAGTFSAAGYMTTGRTGQTATLLPNGKVIVIGGGIASAELYDPTTSAFTATGSMAVGRNSHTATLLPNGKVLVIGGCGCTSAELFQ